MTAFKRSSSSGRRGLPEPPLVYGTEEDGRLLGYVIYHAYDPDSMELGWVLSPDCWGRAMPPG